MEKKREAGAAATREEMHHRERLHRAGKPRDLDPAQECHMCHHGLLEKRTVVGLFSYYACTNEVGCCLMFWRKPTGAVH